MGPIFYWTILLNLFRVLRIFHVNPWQPPGGARGKLRQNLLYESQYKFCGDHFKLSELFESKWWNDRSSMPTNEAWTYVHTFIVLFRMHFFSSGDLLTFHTAPSSGHKNACVGFYFVWLTTCNQSDRIIDRVATLPQDSVVHFLPLYFRVM